MQSIPLSVNPYGFLALVRALLFATVTAFLLPACRPVPLLLPDSRVETPEAPWTETVRFDEKKEFERFLQLFPEVAPQNLHEALGRITQDISDTSGCLPPELASYFIYETLNIDRGAPRAFDESRFRAVGRFFVGSEAVALIYEVVPLVWPRKEYQLRLTTFSRKYPHPLETLLIKRNFCCKNCEDCFCFDYILLSELDPHLRIRTRSLMEELSIDSPVLETPENQRQFYEFDCEYQIMPNGRIRGLKREVRFTVGTYEFPSGSPRMLQLSDWPTITKYEGPIRWWKDEK